MSESAHHAGAFEWPGVTLCVDGNRTVGWHGHVILALLEKSGAVVINRSDPSHQPTARLTRASGHSAIG